MSLPLIIIFERHWDPIPKQVVLDFFKQKSDYDTLCVEAPEDLTSTQIIDRFNHTFELDNNIHDQAIALLRRVNIVKNLSEISFSTLAHLMQLYVSSQKYSEVATKIKSLPASHIYKQILSLPIKIKGVDIGAKKYDKLVNSGLDFISQNGLNTERTNRLFENLVKVQKECGALFLCGALHAEDLIPRFAQRGLSDKVRYFFPHSSKSLEEGIDDIFRNAILANHTYLLTEKEIPSLTGKIFSELPGAIPEGNTISSLLSRTFQVNVRVFIRPDYFADAFIPINPKIDAIHQRLQDLGLQTYLTHHQKGIYLVIPNINTPEVHHCLQRL